MLKQERKNWVNMDMKNNINIEKSRDSFMLKKIKDIFFKWNIIFFKLTNLKKNKIKLYKIKLYKNTFIFYYKNIKKLNLLLKINKNIWENKINVLSINYNGYYLNYNVIVRWKFSNILFEKVYINLFIKLICGLIIKLLLNLLMKSLFFIKYNFIAVNMNFKKNV